MALNDLRPGEINEASVGVGEEGCRDNMHRIFSLFYPSIALKNVSVESFLFFFFTFISLYCIFPFSHSPAGVAGNFPCCAPHRSPRLARIQANQWWRRQRSTGGGAPRPIASTECLPFRWLWCVGTAGEKIGEVGGNLFEKVQMMIHYKSSFMRWMRGQFKSCFLLNNLGV